MFSFLQGCIPERHAAWVFVESYPSSSDTIILQYNRIVNCRKGERFYGTDDGKLLFCRAAETARDGYQKNLEMFR